MRAHFAGDVAIVEAPKDAADDSIDKIEAEAEPLDARIDEFKLDTKNMEVVSEFIDDVLQKAETEAEKQQDAKSDKASQQVRESVDFTTKNKKKKYEKCIALNKVLQFEKYVRMCLGVWLI